MKKISLLAAVLAGLSLGVSGARAQSTQPTVNWTGFYIGGHGGYQWSSIDLGFEHELPGLGTGVSLDTDGGMGGVHGGVQQQFGNWVLGVELSGDWGGGEVSASGAWQFDGLSEVNPPDIPAIPSIGVGCPGGPGCFFRFACNHYTARSRRTLRLRRGVRLQQALINCF